MGFSLRLFWICRSLSYVFVFLLTIFHATFPPLSSVLKMSFSDSPHDLVYRAFYMSIVSLYKRPQIQCSWFFITHFAFPNTYRIETPSTYTQPSSLKTSLSSLIGLGFFGIWTSIYSVLVITAAQYYWICLAPFYPIKRSCSTRVFPPFPWHQFPLSQSNPHFFLWTHPLSIQIPSLCINLCIFPNQDHYKLNSNYIYLSVSNSIEYNTFFQLHIIHQNENLIQNYLPFLLLLHSEFRAMMKICK